MAKVLIIEDEAFLLEVYRAKIKKAGYKTFTAEDGEDGLIKAKKFKPDVILLDLLLPKKNGFDVLADLKDDKELKNIPVIVLSNLGQERDIEQVKQLGAVDYLIKSNVSMKRVLEKIAVVLKKGKTKKSKI